MGIMRTAALLGAGYIAYRRFKKKTAESSPWASPTSDGTLDPTGGSKAPPAAAAKPPARH